MTEKREVEKRKIHGLHQKVVATMSNNNQQIYKQLKREMLPSIYPRDNIRVPSYAIRNEDERPQEVWMNGRKQMLEGVPVRKINYRKPQIRPVPVNMQTSSRCRLIPSVTNRYSEAWQYNEDINEGDEAGYSESFYDFSTKRNIAPQQRRVIQTKGPVGVKFPTVAAFTNEADGFKFPKTNADPKPGGGFLSNAQILRMKNKPAKAAFSSNESSVTVQESTKYINRPPAGHPQHDHFGSPPTRPSRVANPSHKLTKLPNMVQANAKPKAKE